MGQGTILQHNLGQRVECGECEKFIQIVGNYETFKWLCRACHDNVYGETIPNRNNAGREKMFFYNYYL